MTAKFLKTDMVLWRTKGLRDQPRAQRNNPHGEPEALSKKLIIARIRAAGVGLPRNS